MTVPYYPLRTVCVAVTPRDMRTTHTPEPDLLTSSTARRTLTASTQMWNARMASVAAQSGFPAFLGAALRIYSRPLRIQDA